MPGKKLIETVTQKRAEQARREISERYPDASVTYEIGDDRGVITACQGRFIVSREFVETGASLNAPGRMTEYARVLMGKSRLVVVVPKDDAVRTWMRLLEFNNFWLFYHQVHYYDESGEIRHVDRKTWRKMKGLPSDEPERAPEVV